MIGGLAIASNGFVGDGPGLTSVNAITLNNEDNAYLHDAGNLSGVYAALDGSAITNISVDMAALAGTTYAAGDGSAITNVDAATVDGQTAGDILAAAASYADAGDVTTLSSANSYTDAGDAATLSAGFSYSDAGDASTLATAESYSDAGDASTLATAETWAAARARQVTLVCTALLGHVSAP